MSSLPKQSELAQAILEVLKLNATGLSVGQIEELVVRKLMINEEDRNVIRSGKRTELAYRLSWARTKLKAEGLINKSAIGQWKFTDIN
jgi:restriction endonuclease Mrr